MPSQNLISFTGKVAIVTGILHNAYVHKMHKISPIKFYWFLVLYSRILYLNLKKRASRMYRSSTDLIVLKVVGNGCILQGLPSIVLNSSCVTKAVTKITNVDNHDEKTRD